MKKRVSHAICVCMLATMLAVGALKPSQAFLDKTRFVTDLGVAFFAFHHWVWNPYKAGSFKASEPHHIKAMVKGGMALLFVVNRVKAADHLAHVSKSPTLHKLAGLIDKLQSGLESEGRSLKAHKFDAASIGALGTSVTALHSEALKGGFNIKDIPIHIPGL